MDIDKKNSYIDFRIGTEQFAVSVFKVLEIIQFDQITQVPDSSPYILGIINFRGSIVPVIDMHHRFNIDHNLENNNMVVIVDLQNKDKNVLMGLKVDQVTDVLEFEFSSIKSVPDLGVKYNPEFLEGFVEKDGRFIMVLNIDRVLSLQELANIDLFEQD
jgi:purine-binding chemotaxis protein CheW